jgi:hypothetical protein
VKQIRVVDLVLMSAIALVLGELALRHPVLLSRTGWQWVAALSAVTALGLGIAHYVRWMDRLSERRAVREQN